MTKRNRNRRPPRREPFREPKPTILVLSEGEVTEPEYLKAFKDFVKNQRVDVKYVPGAGATMTIVREAKRLKEENEKQAQRKDDDYLRYDQVWCVFDVDEHPDVDGARVMARDNGIELAISNPCVELWLWLHFADQPGMQHRHDLQKMLRHEHLPGYDKHVNFDDLKAGYEDAVRRAKRLDEDAHLANEGEGRRNPSTGFWRLTEKIRDTD